MEKMTPECSAVVKLLGDLINAEVAKPDGEADMDFVMECDALLSDILDEKFPLTDEEINARLAKLKTKTEEKPKKLPNLSIIGRRSAGIAAAVAAAFLGVYGTYSRVPAFHDWVNDSLNLAQSDEITAKKSDFLEITSVTYHKDETDSPKITIEFSNPTLVYSVDLSGGYIESGEENITSDEESEAVTKRLGSYLTACWKLLWDTRDTLSGK